MLRDEIFFAWESFSPSPQPASFAHLQPKHRSCIKLHLLASGSGTRFGDFCNIWRQILLQNLSKYLATFWAVLKNMTFKLKTAVASFWYFFEKVWLLFIITYDGSNWFCSIDRVVDYWVNQKAKFVKKFTITIDPRVVQTKHFSIILSRL